jgi:hypothetical protein
LEEEERTLIVVAFTRTVGWQAVSKRLIAPRLICRVRPKMVDIIGAPIDTESWPQTAKHVANSSYVVGFGTQQPSF